MWKAETLITCASLHHNRDLALPTRSAETWNTTGSSPPSTCQIFNRRKCQILVRR
jgi:hypothetical protein